MMNSGKMTTIARPYAAAAFEVAHAKKDLLAWANLLHSAANLTKDPVIAQLLLSPVVTTSQLADLFCEILASQLNAERKNFIRLLAENKRLAALPDIAVLVSAYQREQEKTVSVQVVSAEPLSEGYRQKLVKALVKRLQRQVELECEQDASLIGGVLIRAGDMVIDGSVKGKLARLMEFI